MRYSQSLMALLLGVLTSHAAVAAGLAPIHVENAWSRESPPMATVGVVYLQVMNMGSEEDRLLGGITSVAEGVEIHTTLMEGGLMKMRQLDSVPVPPGGKASLEPSGKHIMLVGLRQPLKAGTEFSLRLRFANAGEMVVSVPVRSLSGMAEPAGMDHSKMDPSGMDDSKMDHGQSSASDTHKH